MNEITHESAGGCDRRRTGHEEAWDLLPWYVNGSLEEPERSDVEAHLAACGICREEARYWRDFAELAREDGDLAVSPQDGLERLRRRLAPSAPQGIGSRPAVRRGWLAPLRRTPTPVRWLLAAQLAGLLLLTGLLAVPAGAPDTAPTAPGGTSAAFHTLSDPAPLVAVGADVPLLHVVFSDQTREREMRGTLISVGGRIVAGPSPMGVYTVAVAPEDDVTKVLETLRALPQVLLAEPAVGSEGRR